MEFLSTLHTDVKLLLLGGAIALVAALLSASKRREHQFMALFTVFMAVAGVRYHQQSAVQAADEAARADTAISQLKSGNNGKIVKDVRPVITSTHSQ